MLYLFIPQVSESLIAEIEDIIKEKILENIKVNDEVTALTDLSAPKTAPSDPSALVKPSTQADQSAASHVGAAQSAASHVGAGPANEFESSYWGQQESRGADPYRIDVSSGHAPVEAAWGEHQSNKDIQRVSS